MNGTKDTVVALMLASVKEAMTSTVGSSDLSDKVSSDRQFAVVGRCNIRNTVVASMLASAKESTLLQG